MFYGQLTEGARNIGGPKKRYEDHVKRPMKKFNLDPGRLETAAADRVEWRRSVHDGTPHFEGERTGERKERSRI